MYSEVWITGVGTAVDRWQVFHLFKIIFETICQILFQTISICYIVVQIAGGEMAPFNSAQLFTQPTKLNSPMAGNGQPAEIGLGLHRVVLRFAIIVTYFF